MTHSTSPAAPLGTRAGSEVVFTRTFHAPAEVVWAACTDPERMKRWIGTWSGDPASGQVSFRMTAEGDDVPEEPYLIEACEPPHRLAIRTRDSHPFSADGTGPQVHWQHTLELTETDGITTLRFTQVVPDGPLGVDVAGSVGPGWDYYLDRLAAALDGQEVGAIEFEPYLAREQHYRSLFG